MKEYAELEFPENEPHGLHPNDRVLFKGKEWWVEGTTPTSVTLDRECDSD